MNTKTSLHPIVVLNFESRAVEETVIIGTGVDSAAGVNPVRGKKKSKADHIPQETERVFDGEGFWSKVWGSLPLEMHVEQGREGRNAVRY